jgi:hypothetical protein
MRVNIFYLIILSILILTGCRESLNEPEQPSNISLDEEFIFTKFHSPVYLQKFSPGETMEISWAQVQNVDNVKIELYRKTVFQRIITESTLDKGSYEWHIPILINHSRHYRIKISNIDNESQSLTSDDFYIDD